MTSINHDLATVVWGVFGWLSIVSLPGLWVTFGLPLRGFSFWTRVLLGTALAPVIVLVQFYGLRLSGISFATTVPMLVAINLPALYLIWLRREEILFPPTKVLIGAAAVLMIPVALLLPQLLDSQVRIFTGHAWMQSDIVYMIADGALRLEEPELAGIRLAYPWGAHPFQAVLSYLLNSPPASSYIWTNLVWLILTYGFAACIVGELGGNRFSKITSVLCLFFALNYLGYVVFVMGPQMLSGNFWEHGPFNYAWIGGDYRITPWFLKFFFFEHSIMGQALMSATVFILLKKRISEMTWDSFLLIGVLLCGIALIYPVYFVPTTIVVVVAGMLPFIVGVSYRHDESIRSVFWLGIVVLVASVFTYVCVKFLNVDRVFPSIFSPALSRRFVKFALIKSGATAVSLSLLVVGVLFAVRRSWSACPEKTAILLGSGIGCALLYILLELPAAAGNEYKFLLNAAVFLAPFPVLALQPYLTRLGNRALPAFGVLVLVLAAPSAHKIVTDFPWTPPWEYDGARANGFDLRSENAELATLCDRIREQTPADAIIVTGQSTLHFPTLTHRSLYAPPRQEKPYPGVFIMSGNLLSVQKGYAKELIDYRRIVVKELFDPLDGSYRSRSIIEIQKLQRSLVILLDKKRDTALETWLAADESNTRVFDGAEWSAWQVNRFNDDPY